MAVIEFPDQVSRILTRPDFRSLSAGVSVRITADLRTSFAVLKSGEVLLHSACAADAFSGAVAIRHALELLLLRRLWPLLLPLADLAAARTAAIFACLEGPGGSPPASDPAFAAPDYAALAFDAPAGAGLLQSLRTSLASYGPDGQPKLPAALFGLIARIWPMLGPADWLMRAGGRQSLRSDPAGGKDAHCCGLRPRPLEMSFASAAESSVSDRSYAAAEAMRQELLAGIVGNASAANGTLATVRGVIRTSWGLPPGTFVALAASSAEAELFAIAAVQGAPDESPVTVVLAAPAEIDEGVAAAAVGRHPAPQTALGIAVQPLALIEGYRDDTDLRVLELRDGNGAVRSAADISGECAGIAAAATAAGRRVVLHHLDVSRTGLLAPDTSALMAIQERQSGRLDVIVDASQARLSPERIWDYLALGWMVLITGSKFLTGPSPSAALLVPETLRDRFARKLPIGLREYSSRAEWPPSLAAASQLPPGGDVGLALRWSAGLAEWHAFNAVSPAEQLRIVNEFSGSVRSAVTSHHNLLLVDTPVPQRAGIGSVADELTWNGAVWRGTCWDATETVLSFAVRDPINPGWMSPSAASLVHDRLLEDISPFLPDGASAAERALARRLFRVGQAVTLSIAGRETGVLSMSVSTRLLTAQPSHTASSMDERLARAIGDAEAALEKVSLILRDWRSLCLRAPETAVGQP